MANDKHRVAIYRFLASTILLVFVLAVTWEFIFEKIIRVLSSRKDEPFLEHLEFIVLSTTLATIGTLLAGRKLLKSDALRKLTEEELQNSHYDLETKITERTRDLVTVNKELAREIEKHNRSEKARNESETKYEKLFENASDAILIAEAETGIFVDANKAAENLLGMPRGEIIGLHITKVHPQENIDDYHARFKKHVNGGGLFENDMIVRHRNGHDIPVEVRSSIAEVAGKKVMIGIFTDITQRKLAEEVLRESEAQLRTLINSIPDIVIFKDPQCKWMEANDFTLELFDLKDVDYKGKTDSELGDIVKFHKPAFLYCDESDKKAWEKRIASRADETIPQENAPEKVFDVIKVPIYNEDGSRKALLVVGRDITGLKRADEERVRLATAAEQSPESIIITDTEGKVQYVNPMFEKRTGYSYEEVIGENPRMLKSGMHDHAFYETLWKTIVKGNVWKGNMINKRKDGTLFEESAAISPVFDNNGQVVNYVAIKKDITQEKAFSRAKEYFAAVTSHELRAPLTKLKLISMMHDEFALDSSESEELKKIGNLLTEVSAEFERVVSATTLLASLRDVPDKYQENLKTIYLYMEITQCVEKARYEAAREKRQISFTTDLDSLQKNVEIIGDHELVIRAISEVISNAVKFTPNGKAVTVSGSISGDFAVISVLDEGKGMPKAAIEKALEPFFSFENYMHHSTGQYKYKGGGVGLGLTITRMIMEFHGGNLSMGTSGKTGGTSIVMKFPVAGSGRGEKENPAGPTS